MFNINIAGTLCKIYRKEVLALTLKEMSEKTGVSASTISSFENGRSNNLKHLDLYLECSSEEQKEIFRKGIEYKVK